MEVFSNLPLSMVFLKCGQETYLKRFLKIYWPNIARLSRRRAPKKLSGSDPALLHLSTSCTRMDHLPVFLEYNIHNPRAKLNSSKRNIRLVDAHKVIHWYSKGPRSTKRHCSLSSTSIRVTEWKWKRYTRMRVADYLPDATSINDGKQSNHSAKCLASSLLQGWETCFNSSWIWDNSTYLPKWCTMTSDVIITPRRRSLYR